MDNIIVFDSDFIIANILDFKDILSKFKNYSCFVSEISINEVAAINSNNKIETISDFKTNLKNYKQLGTEFNLEEADIKKKIKDSSINYISELFEKKIIMNHNRTLSTLLERAYSKIPPFGKSDKGFKDTIILLDIIDYIKGKNVLKMFFVTNDDDFIKNYKMIHEEVMHKTKCDFVIVDGKQLDKLYNYFRIGNSEAIEKLSKEIKTSKIDEKVIRKDLNEICNKLFHYNGFDEYSFEDFIGDNFKSTSHISKDMIKIFLSNLTKNISENIFNSSVTISKFFDDPFLFMNEKKINIEVFEKLNNIYLDIKDNYIYLDALINLLYSNFSSLTDVEVDEKELPFF